MFDRLAGNAHIKHYLSTVIQKGSTGNSLLFAGPDGIGKGLFAVEFAKEVLASNDPTKKIRLNLEKGCCSDLHLYKPEGKTGLHGIDAMRRFSEEVYLPPLEAKTKVFILLDADRMLPTSANALLKTFEEPSPDTLIILVSSKPSALLPTILSRCRKLYFHALSTQEIVQVLESEGIDNERACTIAPIAQGSVSQALRLLRPEFSARREKLLQILSEGKMKDYSELSKYAQEIAKEIEAANDAWAEELRNAFKKSFSDKPSAFQQQAMDKELDGAISMKEKTEVLSLFEVILSWYRDLEVLAIGLPVSQLINREYVSELQTVRGRGAVDNIENVFKAVRDVQTLLDRSTSLAICLENLFLKINLL